MKCDTLRFGVTPDSTCLMMHQWFHIDVEHAKDWSLDSVAKRTIAVAALVLLMVGSFPLLNGVHGQSPQEIRTQQEVDDMRAQIQKLDNVTRDLAVVIAHQQIEDERFAKQEEFEGKVVWGFLGTSGGMLLALFGWALNQFGVSIGLKNNNARHR